MVDRNLFDVRGKRILITGSTAGLGYELARGFVAAGADVILNGRNPEKLKAALASLSNEQNTLRGCCFDVCTEAEIQKSIQELGHIDVLINNAGIQRRGTLEQIRLETWNEVLETNLTAPWLVAREVVRPMIERGEGKIINICSLMSDLGRATTGPYTAAKGGLKMLTRAMCADWARYNIQVNAIGPGYFLTEMTRPLAEQADFNAWVKQRTPAGRWGTPSELMGVAILLSSEASAFINGQIFYVDGGMSAVL